MQCTAIASSTSAATLVNGALQPLYSTSGFAAPGGRITINTGYNPGQVSFFGAAELILWNRSLSLNELYAASSFLAVKYCIAFSQ